jgi:hypothetical protein
MTITRRAAITASAITGLALTAGLAAAQERREQHPKIRAAIRALQQAKDDMQHAAHDFGGHRVDALRACDQAIEQLRLALNYDKH